MADKSKETEKAHSGYGRLRGIVGRRLAKPLNFNFCTELNMIFIFWGGVFRPIISFVLSQIKNLKLKYENFVELNQLSKLPFYKTEHFFMFIEIVPCPGLNINRKNQSSFIIPEIACHIKDIHLYKMVNGSVSNIELLSERVIDNVVTDKFDCIGRELVNFYNAASTDNAQINPYKNSSYNPDKGMRKQDDRRSKKSNTKPKTILVYKFLDSKLV